MVHLQLRTLQRKRLGNEAMKVCLDVKTTCKKKSLPSVDPAEGPAIPIHSSFENKTMKGMKTEKASS